MNEILFLVEEAVDGDYNAEDLRWDNFTEADTLEELRGNIKAAVVCHFDGFNA